MNRRLTVSVMLVLMVGAVGIAMFAGSAAAISGANETTLTQNTTNDDTTVTVVGELSSSVTNVDKVNVSLANSPATNISDLTASDVEVVLDGTQQTVSGITKNDLNADTHPDTVNISVNLGSAAAGDTLAVRLGGENVTNGNTSGTYNANIDLNNSAGGSAAGFPTVSTFTIEPSLVITDTSLPRAAAYNDTITVEATIENQGTSDIATVESNYSADNLGGGIPGTVEVASETFNSPAGATNTSTFTVDTANTTDGGDFGTLTDGDTVNSLVHGFNVTDNSTGVEEDIVSGTLEVGTNNTDGAVSAEVRDTSGFPVQNANVSLYVNSVDPANLIAENVTADAGPNNNFIRFSSVSPTKPESDVNLAVGPNSTDSAEYVVRANKPQFQADSRSAELHENNVESTVFPELTPLISAAEINVEQDAESAVARNQTEIGFDIEVYDDFGGNIYTDADIQLEVNGEDNSSVYVRNDDTGNVYNGVGAIGPIPTNNGKLNLSTFAETTQRVEYTFSAPSNNSAIITGNGPAGVALNTPRTKDFVLSGEGELQGEVYDQATTNPVEDASVWAVNTTEYETNSKALAVNLSALDDAFPTVDRSDSDVDADTVYARLVDNETGAPLARDEYDVRQDGAASRTVGGVGVVGTDTLIRELSSLNTSDPAQGAGFALIDDDSDNYVLFNTTRLAPEEYAIDLSLTGENVSDGRIADGTSENFTRIVGTNVSTNNVIENFDIANKTSHFANPAEIGVPTDRPSVDQALAQPVANLTVENAVEVSEASNIPSENIVGQNLADHPGFVNSFGQDTDGTNQYGQFVLNRIPTDFQNGYSYTVIADAPGYDNDFARATVDEDGDISFSNQGSTDFQLTPVDVGPGFVNITNYGLHPPLSQTGGVPDLTQIDQFSNKSDDVEQQVPRDGSVDVITVETRSESGGQLLNATVDLQVPEDAPNGATADEYNFTGEIVDVLGGGLVSDGPEVDSQTFHTGDNFTSGGFNLGTGEAVVLLEADESPETLNRSDVTDNSANNAPPTNETGVFAQLTNDVTATDFTNKEFVGVLRFETASISGFVSDSNDVPLPGSPVWAGQFTLQDPGSVTKPDRMVIEPNTTESPGSPAFADAVDDPTDDFVVQRQVYNATSGNYETAQSDIATGSELKKYEFDAFPSITTNDSFKLWQIASTGDATYSLEPVPAVGGAGNPNTEYRIRSVRAGGSQTNIGTLSNDALVTVQTQTTGTGNVVIPIQVSTTGDYALSNLDPNDATVTEGDAPIDVSVDVTNNAGLQGDQALTLEVTNASGTQYTDTVSNVQVDAGNTDTVTFTGVPAGDLSAGNYTHTVSSDDDTVSGDLEVQSSGGGGSPGGSGAAAYDDDNNGEISTGELQNAINDFTSGSIDTGQLQDVIQAFVSGSI